MTGLLAQMEDMAQQIAAGMWPAVLVFLRVGAVMALLPAFGEQIVPQRIRLVLTLAFSAVVAPAVWADLPANPPAAALGIEVIDEAAWADIVKEAG